MGPAVQRPQVGPDVLHLRLRLADALVLGGTGLAGHGNLIGTEEGLEGSAGTHFPHALQHVRHRVFLQVDRAGRLRFVNHPVPDLLHHRGMGIFPAVPQGADVGGQLQRGVGVVPLADAQVELVAGGPLRLDAVVVLDGRGHGRNPGGLHVSFLQVLHDLIVGRIRPDVSGDGVQFSGQFVIVIRHGGREELVGVLVQVLPAGGDVGFHLPLLGRQRRNGFPKLHAGGMAQAEFAGGVNDVVDADFVAQRGAGPPVLSGADAVEVVVGGMADAQFQILVAVGAAALVVGGSRPLVTADLDVAVVVDHGVRVQAALQGGHGRNRLECGTRRHGGHGGVVVQRGRCDHVPGILGLYGFPRLGGDTVGENIRVVARVAGHGQDLASLHVHADDGAALTVSAGMGDTGGQGLLRRLLQVHVDGQLHILSLLGLGPGNGADVGSAGIHLDLLNPRGAVELLLVAALDAFLADQIVTVVIPFFDVIIRLAVGNRPHIPQNVGRRALERVVPAVLGRHADAVDAGFLHHGDGLLRDILRQGHRGVALSGVHHLVPDDKDFPGFPVAQGFRNLVLFPEGTEAFLCGNALLHFIIREDPPLGDEVGPLLVVGVVHVLHGNRHIHLVHIRQLIVRIVTGHAVRNSVAPAHGQERLARGEVRVKSFGFQPLFLVHVVGVVHGTVFPDADREIVLVGVPVLLQQVQHLPGCIVDLLRVQAAGIEGDGEHLPGGGDDLSVPVQNIAPGRRSIDHLRALVGGFPAPLLVFHHSDDEKPEGQKRHQERNENHQHIVPVTECISWSVSESHRKPLLLAVPVLPPQPDILPGRQIVENESRNQVADRPGRIPLQYVEQAVRCAADPGEYPGKQHVQQRHRRQVDQVQDEPLRLKVP